jgi:hypothetical protein
MKHKFSLASRRGIPLFAVALAGCVIAGTAARAEVTPGDTFTFDIAGFNSTSGVGYILGNDQSAVFGTTETYAGAGYNGQNITITSSEVIGATTTTDYFTVSTPTNFLTSATVNGTKITALQFDLGDANSGVTFNSVPDTVDFTTPIVSPTATGYILYSSANTQFALTPVLTQSNNGASLAGVEGVNDGSTAISTLAIHEFELAVTYANPAVSAAPEPGTWLLMIAGVAGIGLAFRKATRREKDGFSGAAAA